MMIKHYLKLIFPVALLTLLCHTAAFAGRGDKTKSIHTPAGGSAVVVGTATAKDSIELDPLGGNQRDYNVLNRIGFGVDMHYPEFVAGPQIVEVSINVKRWDVNSLPLTDLNFKLNIAYYHNDTVKSRILDKYEFNSAYKMVFRIDTIRVNGTPATTLPKNLFVQGDIFVERYTELLTGAMPYNEPQLLDRDCNAINDGIRFAWHPYQGAEEYQLEFMYISDYAEGSSVKSQAELEYNFKRNATRISTSNVFYDIALIFDRGWVAYRVRPIGVDIDDPEHLIFGEWSIATVTGTINDLPSDCKIQITNTDAHEKSLNWSYSVNYAEQGKRKEAITYLDGTLKGRQSVTRTNTNKNVIVGETIYDYQGRPAVSVMPVPVVPNDCDPDSEPVIAYYPDFNQNANGTAYNRQDFDSTGNNLCSITAQPMDTASGASNYYSPANPDQTLQQAYLPDAEGYPFQQVEYTPDNTGRIRRQGGVGPDFQLGSGKETSYLYGNPNQLELNRLFGAEAGYTEHYQKNAVIDANGQVSVSYIDMTGKVVATALAGDAPTNVISLAPASPESLEVNHILPDGSNQTIDELTGTVTFSASFIVTAPTNAVIDYQLLTIPMSDSCLEGICVDCVYELELSLKDDCGESMIPDSLQHKTVGNFQRDINGDYVFHAQCEDSTSFSSMIETHLEIGNYTVGKKLIIKEEAVSAYLDLIDSSTCVLTYQDFLDAEMQQVDSGVCVIDCENCLEQLGSMQDFISNGHGTSGDYYARVEQCQQLCEDRVSDCKMYLTVMELDMSPGGQYAEYLNASTGQTDLSIPLSVLNSNNELPDPSASWKNPQWVTPSGIQNIYVDASGQRSKIYLSEDPANPGNYLPQPVNNSVVQYDAAAGQYYIYPEQLLSVLDFVANFEDSWALSLVKYHPEYCFYESCIQYEDKHADTDAFSSSSFDELLYNTNTFAEAQALGFITSGGLPADWFTPTGNDPTDSLKPWDPFVYYGNDFSTGICDGYGAKLVNKFNHFEYQFGQWYTMAEIAAYTARCGSNFPSVPPVDCYNFGQLYNGVVDTAVLNSEWSILKALYMSAKQGFQQELANCKAVAYCDAFNNCIGNTSYTPFPVFGYIQTGPSTQYYPFLDPEQPCSVFSAHLYRYKIKRFSNHQDAMLEDANSTAYELYLQTGQCPTAFALQNLLNELAGHDKLTASSFNLSSTSYLSALFQANNSFYNPGTSPALTYAATTTTDTITANWNDGVSTLATLVLSKTAPQSWADVTGIVNLFATGANTFAAEATYYDTVNSTVAVFPLAGSLSYFKLNSCTFEQECKSSQLALDLTTVFNVLNLDDTLQSTSPVSLSSYSSPSIGSTVSLVSLYIENAANMGNDLSIVSPWTDLWRIYDSSVAGNDGLYIQFTGMTGSLTSDITGYEPMISTGNYSFEMQAQQAVGYPVTYSGVMYQVHNGDTIGISAGDCDLPVPAKCQGQPYEVFNDLQPLLENVLINYNGSSNIDLYASVYTTPSIVSAFPTGQSQTSSIDTGDSLIISSGACDIVLTMDTSQYVQFDNLVAVGNFELSGELNNQSAYNNFTAIGTFETTSGTIQDTIWGSTCFSLKDCHPCSDSASSGISALMQLAVPMEELSMMSPEESFFETFALAAYDTTGCSAGYNTYLSCIADFNESYVYYQITPMTKSSFILREYCHCMDAYCEILDEILASELQFPNFSAFSRFVDPSNACKPCQYYSSYLSAIGNYNANTNTYHVLDTIPQNLFNAYGYCNCAKDYEVLLVGIIRNNTQFINQEHFNNYASIARICSKDVINEEEDPCKIAYDSYLGCINNFKLNNTTPYTLSVIPNYQFDSLGLCSCVDAFCSALDAILAGIVVFDNQTDFDNYVFGKLDCNRVPPCAPAPSSGVLPEMPTVSLENDCIAMQVNLAIVNAQNAYNQYVDSVKTVHRQKYMDHCLKTQEKLFTNYDDKQYHYMLYYYDIVGNLIKTVPPAGVSLLPISSTDDPLNIMINKNRDIGLRTVFTSHRMQTRYEYNSLGQLVAQYNPDMDAMTAFEQNLPNGLYSKFTTTKIEMINQSLGYLAGSDGNRGYLYKTTDGGRTWSRVHNLVAADLKKIVMLDSNLGVAVGQAGTILKTVDGGQSWDMIISWNTAGMTESLNDVAVINPTSSPTIMVVGDNGVAASCTNFSSASPTFTMINTGLSGNVMSIEAMSGVFYCTTHDPVADMSRFYMFSSTWTELPNVVTTDFSAVDFYNTNEAYAADMEGRIYFNADVSNANSKWIHRSANLKDSILQIRFFNQQQGVALVKKNGIGKLYRTIDAAKTWTVVSDSNYAKIAISENKSMIASAGTNKRVSILFPYASGTDQVLEVNGPALAGDLTAVWVEEETNGNVRLIVADNNEIFYTQDALVANPVWLSSDYSSVTASAIIKIEAELMPGGEIYGVVLTSALDTYRLKRDVAPQAELVPYPFSGTYFDISKGDNYFYFSRSSGQTFRRANFDNSFTVTNVGALPFSARFISMHSQEVIGASNNGSMAYTVLNSLGTSIDTSYVHTQRVYPDKINRLRKDNTATKLLAYGNDGLVYHWNAVSSQFVLLKNRMNENIYDAYTDNLSVYLVGQNGMAKKGTNTSYISLAMEDMLTSSGQTVAGTIPNTDLFGIMMTPGKRLYMVGAGGTILYTPVATGTGSIAPSLVAQGGPDLYNVARKNSSEKVLISGENARIQEQFGAMGIVNNNVFIPGVLDIHFRDAASATLIAGNYVARTTSNGTARWNIIKPVGNQNPAATYQKAWTLPGGKSLLFGNGNTLLYTQNTGLTSTAFTATDVKALAKGTDDQHLYFTDGNLVRKLDLNSLSASTVHTMSISDPVHAMHVFSNGDHIVVGGNGLYKHYTAAGTLLSYTTGLPSVDFYDLAFSDNLNGVIVGFNGIYYKAQNPTVSVDGYLQSTQWQLNNLSATDPLGITASDIYTIAMASATEILVGGKNPGSYTNPQYPYVRKIHDAGGRYTNRFYYDRLGRVVVSRNSRQEKEDKYSYVLYDALGRMVEAGEKAENTAGGEPRFENIFGEEVSGYFSPVTISDQKLNDWITAAGPRTEVTRSYYDTVAITGLPASLAADQTTQRHRILHATYEDVFDGNDQTFDHATHYSYDIHGNVKTLVQDNRRMATDFPSLAANRFKEVEYSYDLLSGNVHRMSVQPGEADQWHHAFTYDADNRIRKVYTNTHEPLTEIGRLTQDKENELSVNADWQNDAQYYFYNHGPLSRVEIGQNNLQGIDSYYNLQGWLKGVNSSTLEFDDNVGNNTDPGHDSDPNELNAFFAKDVFGFSLHYYTGDYSAISGATPQAGINSGSHAAANSFDLYNGNIRYMQTAITNPTNRKILPMLSAYKYDQLQRLVQSRSYLENALDGNAQWNPLSYNREYLNIFKYDAMGNILTQDRHSADGTQLEDLDYKYQHDANSKLMRNRLYHVDDAITDNVDSTDIDDMGTFDSAPATINVNNNYVYDAQGRLVKDLQEEIDTIIWTATDKVKEIHRTSASVKENLVFDYDATGRRIAKHIYDKNWVLMKSTYYVLDGKGTPANIYEHSVDGSAATFYLTERNIYGASRLGTVRDTVNLLNPIALPSYGILGNRGYEETNHLGNVLAVISDVVYPMSANSTDIDYYEVGIIQVSDYSPFGVLLDDRNLHSSSIRNYRFGFQGQERDDEIKGPGNSLNYEYRMHDPRLGRFFAIDPLTGEYPYYSPYVFSGNRVIDAVELEGLEPSAAGKLGEVQVAQGSDGEWHKYQWSEVGTNHEDWVDQGTDIRGYGMAINLPKNASEVKLKRNPAYSITLSGTSLGSNSIGKTTINIPETYIVESFVVNGQKYLMNFKDGEFNGYWNLGGGKFSNKLNSDGTYKGDSYETYMQRSIDWTTLKKLKLNSNGWKAYAAEAGLNIAQDILMERLIKKGGGENYPQAPIDFGSSWDNYIDKFIKYGLMVYGPGTVYLAPNCDPNYPEYTHVQYWFKGYYGENKAPIFDVKPIKQMMADESH